MPREYKTPTQDKIVEFLKTKPYAEITDIMGVLGCTKANAHKAVSVLLKDDRLMEGGQVEGSVGRPAIMYSLNPFNKTNYPRVDKLKLICNNETR